MLDWRGASFLHQERLCRRRNLRSPTGLLSIISTCSCRILVLLWRPQNAVSFQSPRGSEVTGKHLGISPLASAMYILVVTCKCQTAAAKASIFPLGLARVVYQVAPGLQTSAIDVNDNRGWLCGSYEGALWRDFLMISHNWIWRKSKFTNTIRKVKYLSKNSILTIFLGKSKLSSTKKSKPAAFSRVFTQKFSDNF